MNTHRPRTDAERGAAEEMVVRLYDQTYERIRKAQECDMDMPTHCGWLGSILSLADRHRLAAFVNAQNPESFKDVIPELNEANRLFETYLALKAKYSFGYKALLIAGLVFVATKIFRVSVSTITYDQSHHVVGHQASNYGLNLSIKDFLPNWFQYNRHE